MPKVSVIMNCLNCSRYLREAVDSVYAQTYTDWEIIFWDNASTDDSAEIAKSYNEKLKYFRGSETVPLGAARNKALEQARGEFIAFLDCDDIWLPHKLGKQIPLFEKNPKVGLVFCDTIFLKENKNLYRLYKKDRPLRGMVFRELLKNYFLSMETVLVRKETLLSLDHWFDDTFIMAEEMDLFLRIAYNWELDYVDEPLAKWRMHEASASYKYSYLIPQEKEIILNKLSKLYPDFKEKYSKEIEEQKKMISYQWALSKWKDGNAAETRKYIKPYILKDKIIFVTYFFSMIPYNWYIYLKEKYHKLKYGS